jgi:hypothetical protein
MIYLVIGIRDDGWEFVDAIFRDVSDAEDHKRLCERLTPQAKYRIDERHLR